MPVQSRLLVACFALLACVATPSPAPAQSGEEGERVLIMATGPVTGSGYAAGGAVQRLVNRAENEHQIRLLVEATGGDAENLKGLDDGRYDLALIQSDLVDQSVHTALFSLTQAGLIIAVRAESDATELADLAGRKIGLNDPEDRLFPSVWAGAGLDPKALSKVSRADWGQQAAALCGDQVEALVVTAPPPHAGIYAAAATCRIRFIPVPLEVISRLTRARAGLVPVTIPAAAYPGVEENAASIGVPLVLVSRNELGEQAGFDLTKTVFEAFDDLRRQHPALTWLSQLDAATHTFDLPRNPGSESYFRAVDLLPQDTGDDDELDP